MRTTAVVLLALASAVRFAVADDITLKDAAGTTFGPFPVKEGAALRLNDIEYRIASVTNTAEQRLLRRMATIVIPEIAFKETPMEDAVEFLRKAGKKNDPSGEGVNIAFTASPWGFATNRMSAGDTNIAASVTVSARQIPLLDALKTLCTVSGFRLVLRPNAVMVLPANAPAGLIARRAFDTLPSFTSRLAEFIPQGDETSPSEGSHDLKATFAGFGISWPKGSSITEMPVLGKLIVVNTEENLDAIEKVLGILNVLPSQIRMEFFFVAFPSSMVERAESGRHFTSEDALKLWQDGKGRAVSTMLIITKSAAEATFKDVTEVIYPTEFTVTPILSATNDPTSIRGVTGEPGGFETREVGAIVSVMPETTPDGQMIDMTLTPQFVEEPFWESYDAMFITNSAAVKVGCRQPLFAAHSYSTQMSIHCGVPIVMSGGWRLKRTPEVMYLILRADIVAPDGKVIPRAASAGLQNILR